MEHGGEYDCWVEEGFCRYYLSNRENSPHNKSTAKMERNRYPRYFIVFLNKEKSFFKKPVTINGINKQIIIVKQIAHIKINMLIIDVSTVVF